MKGIGVLLAALGALIMSTSVSSPILASVHDGASVGGVYNLGLLQHQLMIFVAGLAVALSGVGIAFAAIVIGQRPKNGNVNDESQISGKPREPSASTLPLTTFTAQEGAEVNKRADRGVFLLLGGVAVVALIVAGITVA